MDYFDVNEIVVSYRESLYQSFKALGKDIHWLKWDTYQYIKIDKIKNYEHFLPVMI